MLLVFAHGVRQYIIMDTINMPVIVLAGILEPLLVN